MLTELRLSVMSVRCAHLWVTVVSISKIELSNVQPLGIPNSWKDCTFWQVHSTTHTWRSILVVGGSVPHLKKWLSALNMIDNSSMLSLKEAPLTRVLLQTSLFLHCAFSEQELLLSPAVGPNCSCPLKVCTGTLLHWRTFISSLMETFRRSLSRQFHYVWLVKQHSILPYTPLLVTCTHGVWPLLYSLNSCSPLQYILTKHMPTI